MKERTRCSRLVPLLIALAFPVLPGCRPRTEEPNATPAGGQPAYLGPSICIAVESGAEGARIVEELAKYSRLFGSPVVTKEASPDYTISGSIGITEEEPATFQDKVLQYLWNVNAKLELLAAPAGNVVETFVLEDYRLGKTEPDLALRTAVRAGSQRLAESIFYYGETLGHPDVRSLLGRLLIETDEELLYNDIVEDLVDIGYRAVPYLIWSLNDRRSVCLRGDLPGLTEENAGRVRVYHVANYALERIFGRKTLLTVDSDHAEVRRHVAGWQRLWTEHCGAYRQGAALEELRKKAGEVKAE